MAPWLYRLIAVLKFIGLLVFVRVYVALLFHPTWGPVVSWGTMLLGCAWFARNVTSRWYPALKKRPGLLRVYTVLAGLNVLAWFPGYWVARYVLNSLTGVDAGNFPTAL